MCLDKFIEVGIQEFLEVANICVDFCTVEDKSFSFSECD